MGGWPPQRTPPAVGSRSPGNVFGGGGSGSKASSIGFGQDPFGVLQGGRTNAISSEGNRSSRGVQGWAGQHPARVSPGSQAHSGGRFDSQFARKSNSPFGWGTKQSTRVEPARRPLCRYFAKGYCKNGQTCKYSHDVSDRSDGQLEDMAVEGNTEMDYDESAMSNNWMNRTQAYSPGGSMLTHHAILDFKAPVDTIMPSLQVDSPVIAPKVDREIVLDDSSALTGTGTPDETPNQPLEPHSSAAILITDDYDFGPFSSFSEDETFDPYSEPLRVDSLPRFPPPVLH